MLLKFVILKRTLVESVCTVYRWHVLIFLLSAHPHRSSVVALAPSVEKKHLILSCHVYQYLLLFVTYAEYMALLQEEGVMHALGHDTP